MPIQVPADVEAHINQKVARGDFPDADEVIREAMRLLNAQEHQLEELCAKLRSGLDQLDQGEGVLFTPELVDQMRQNAEDRFHRGELPNPDVVQKADGHPLLQCPGQPQWHSA